MKNTTKKTKKHTFNGVEVELFFEEEKTAPYFAELVYPDNDVIHSELSFDGETLIDYDGVFELPVELYLALRCEKLDVSPDCLPEWVVK